MPRSKGKFAEIDVTRIAVIPIDCTVPMDLKRFGGSYYLRVPPEILEYFRLAGRVDWEGIMIKTTVVEAQIVKREAKAVPQ